ncbi:MAG TPA: ribonuclease E activity regulator RraA [Pseudomonadales bacterium]|nr:ribonuclease E activity regulator RraA [Pseudomonadales bacterium]
MTELCLPDLCDAYGDAVDVVEPMFSNFGGRAGFGGPVRTVKCFEDNSLVAERVGEAGDGAVLVVDGGGSLRCALLGDNLADKAAANGWAGVIVYGCVRDVDALAAIDLGVQALASHPLRSVKKGIGEVDVAVTFGGVRFAPGRFVYADNNGVIVADTALQMPAAG